LIDGASIPELTRDTHDPSVNRPVTRMIRDPRVTTVAFSSLQSARACSTQFIYTVRHNYRSPYRQMEKKLCYYAVYRHKNSHDNTTKH